MRYSYLVLISSLLAAAPVAAHDCHGCDHHYHWDHGCCPDCGQVGQSAQQASAPIEELKGTISEIQRGLSTAGVVEAWIKTAQGTVLIRLGPAGFLRQNDLTLNEGASIAVKGFRSEDSLIATEVEVGGKTLLLRSTRGKPLW